LLIEGETNKVKIHNYSQLIPHAIAIISIIAIILYMHWALNPINNWMDIFSNQSVFAYSTNEIKSLGLSNCTIVTNVWTYMWYYGLSAYPSLYYYQTGYNKSLEKYPILLISNAGGVPTNLTKFYNISKTYKLNDNASIYLPANLLCK
jgi:hypothetical protein